MSEAPEVWTETPDDFRPADALRWEPYVAVISEPAIAGLLGRILHNCVAHPLLVLCPPAGNWLHERTGP